MIKRLGSLLALDKESESQTDAFEMSDTMQRAKDQVEYYLSSFNLDHDDFMRKKSTENEDGYIDVSVFIQCNRIKQIGISTDDLLKCCSKSHFLEVDFDNQRIRAKSKYVKDVKRIFRTVRIDGLPKETTVESLYNILIDETAEPESLILQHMKDEEGKILFNGTAIVTFFTEDAAFQALAAPLYFNGEKIKMVLLSDYKKERISDKKKNNYINFFV